MATRSAANRRASIGEAKATNQAVAIYARVSTEDQEERGTIENQVDFLRRFVDLHELAVAGEYVDDGISGALPLGDRPEGQRLLIDAEAGRFGVVLFYNLKRLGRRLSVIVGAHDELARHGVGVRSGTEPIDTSTPTGVLIFQILGSIAEFDRAMISENMSRGRDRVAKKGEYTGGPIPLGYDLDAERRLVESERAILELGVTEAEFVRDLFRRFAAGEATINGECLRLTALGVPRGWRYGVSKDRVPKEGDAPRPRSEKTVTAWSKSSLGAILHNPVYKGEGRLDSRFGAVPRVTPALVDAETWDAAQAALLRNRKLSAKNGKHTYLLRGLIRCQNCGRNYVGAFCKRDRYYRCGGSCSTWKPGPRCDSKMLRADALEDAVWEECQRFIRNPGEALDVARAKLRERMADATRFEVTRRRTLDALAEKETERERVLGLYRRGKIDADEAERELDAIAREAGQLREDLESMRAQSALLDIQETHLAEMAALLARLREELDAIDASNDQARKREVIEAYVRQITVETRIVAPRRKEADVNLALRLEPSRVALESGSRRRSAPRRN